MQLEAEVELRFIFEMVLEADHVIMDGQLIHFDHFTNELDFFQEFIIFVNNFYCHLLFRLFVETLHD